MNDTQCIFSIYDVMDSGLLESHGCAKACMLLKLDHGTFIVEVAHFEDLRKAIKVGSGMERGWL